MNTQGDGLKPIRLRGIIMPSMDELAEYSRDQRIKLIERLLEVDAVILASTEKQIKEARLWLLGIPVLLGFILSSKWYLDGGISSPVLDTALVLIWAFSFKTWLSTYRLRIDFKRDILHSMEEKRDTIREMNNA